MRLAEQLQRSWKPKPQVRFGSVTSVSPGICTVQVAGGEIPVVTLKGAPVAVGDFVAVQRQGVASYLLMPPGGSLIWVSDTLSHLYAYKTPIAVGAVPIATITVPTDVGTVEPIAGGVVAASNSGTATVTRGTNFGYQVPLSSLQSPFCAVSVPAGICVGGAQGVSCYALPGGALLGSFSGSGTGWLTPIPGSSDVLLVSNTTAMRLTTPGLAVVWSTPVASASEFGSFIVNHSGGTAYIPMVPSGTGSSQLLVFDIASGQYEVALQIGFKSSQWYQSDISPDGGTVYFPDLRGSLWAVDIAATAVKWQQVASSAPTGAPSDPSGEYVYSMGLTVDILDSATGTWIGSASDLYVPYYGCVGQ